MACQVNRITQELYWLRYLLEHDGDGPLVVAIDNDRLLEDGGEYLRRIFDVCGVDQAVEAIMCSLRAGIFSTTSPPDAWSMRIEFDADQRPFFLIEKQTAARGSALFELQFVHTAVR